MWHNTWESVPFGVPNLYVAALNTAAVSVEVVPAIPPRSRLGRTGSGPGEDQLREAHRSAENQYGVLPVPCDIA